MLILGVTLQDYCDLIKGLYFGSSRAREVVERLVGLTIIWRN